MRRGNTRAWLVAVVAAGVAACADQSTAPDGPNARTVYGCEMDPECSGGGGGGGTGFAVDTHPMAPGYWMGTTVTPQACISPTGAGISDADLDGTHDYCENLLAERFRPALSFSAYDCDTGQEPYWAAKAFPAQGNVVRVAYLFAYYRDCGIQDPQPLGCSVQVLGGTLLTFNGLLPSYSIGPLPVSPEPLCDGHQGDSEFLILDLAYDPYTYHWYVKRGFFSAHWGTGGDHSRLVGTGGIEYPEKYGGYPKVWAAEGKHANYPSRSACSNDGGIYDTCHSNPDAATRIRHSKYYNVGSARANFISQGTCVTGGRLVAYYPWLYGTECFWIPGNTFAGWSPYPLTTDATPYYTILIVKFECYGMVLGQCVDWGVNR